MAEIVMDPQVKADLSRHFGKKLTTVIFALAGGSGFHGYPEVN
jgi:hypothetical protein